MIPLPLAGSVLFMMIRQLAFISALSLAISAQGQLNKVLNKDSVAKKTSRIQKPGARSSLSNEEVIKGLKEALAVGTQSAVSLAGKADGFYKNPRIYIPWPEEAIEMKARLLKIGFEGKVTEFEMSLNRAAEEAVKQAIPVFTAAIAGMSVKDGFAILNGKDTAATNYLRKNTYDSLRVRFLPVVQEAIEKVEVTRYWNPLVTAYNRLPKVTRQNPDLDEYVTNKAINGLMLLIADEETRIRKDPKARISALLKKVFGR